MGDPATASVYRFGAAELDERSRELRVGGHPLPIEAKPFDVLVQLLRRPGETLTKDELLDAVWPGRVVTEGVLAKCVMKLRALLGDDEQAAIRTVHGFGYRIGVPVERRDAGEAHAFEPRAGDSVPHRANWRLVRALGEGGYALVWLVEHQKTGEQRVFKYARDAAGLTALKREVTIYRMLRASLGPDAPLLRILDWNVDEPPYHIESEYIAGGNLAEWFAAHADTPLPLRLALVAQCADAVAAAHRVGVLHKDLKPGNVLVRERPGAEPAAVLCDFGIGALMEPERLAALGITRQGFTRTQHVDGDDTSGTPLYLAPEVIAGQAPTTRSDVYALGVMLYQLVIGDLRRPLGAGWERDVVDELLREDIAAAADVDPRRRLADAADLSERLRTLDARRGERARQRDAAASAVKLQAQLDRAHARRGWLLATLTVLALGIAVTSTMYVRAQRAADSARAVNRFLNADLLALADPNLSQDVDLKASAMLDRAAERVGERFADQPEAELEIRTTLGRGYRGLGAFERAGAQFERATELAALALPADDPRAIELALWRADLALAESHPARAQEEFERVRDRAASALGPDSRLALEAAVRAAAARFEAGTEVPAVDELRPLLPRLDAALGPRDPLSIFALNRLAIMLNSIERMDEAESVRLEHLARARAAYGEGHSATLTGRLNYAALLRKTGRLPDAMREAEAAEAGLRKVFGMPSVAALHAMNVRGRILLDLGRMDEAEALMGETLEGRLALLGREHDDTAFSYVARGVTRTRQGRYPEALADLREGLAIREQLVGPDHVDVITNLTLIADTERMAGELDAAERDGTEAVRRARAALGRDRPELGNALFRLGQILLANHKPAEARPVLSDAVAVFTAAFGATHARTQAAAKLLDDA